MEFQRGGTPLEDVDANQVKLDLSYFGNQIAKIRSEQGLSQEQLAVWGDRIFEKCGIRRDERGDGGKTLEIRGKRRLPARDRGANYQQS